MYPINSSSVCYEITIMDCLDKTYISMVEIGNVQMMRKKVEIERQKISKKGIIFYESPKGIVRAASGPKPPHALSSTLYYQRPFRPPIAPQ